MPGPSSGPLPERARALLAPLERFFAIEAASGIVLLALTALALIWANSPWAWSYDALWSGPVRFGINDGLMTIFFLVVGLEIRSEMHDGALSSLRQAAVPLAAAVGGIVAPALIYVSIANQDEVLRGWAVPTATDIAFAVGVLAVLGKRVPGAVRVLLLALAILDDIAAILVIAIFYSTGLKGLGLLVALIGVAVVLVLQRMGFKSAWAYVPAGVIVWAGLLYAGVHPTLSGVALGLLTPVMHAERVESALHPWVAYGVMPVFALANAGVPFAGFSFDDAAASSLLYAIVFALFLGKPIGIFAASWVVTKAGLGALSPELNWRGVLLVGVLGGIGFTMSIFIASLAFAEGPLLSAAKLAVLIASGLAAAAGLLLGRFVLLR